MTSNSSAPASIPRQKKMRQTVSAEAPSTWTVIGVDSNITSDLLLRVYTATTFSAGVGTDWIQDPRAS